MYFTEVMKVRITGECAAKLANILKKFPGDYKTKSDVIRAGIYALHRWRGLE